MNKSAKQMAILLILLLGFGSIQARRFLGRKKPPPVPTEAVQVEPRPEVPGPAPIEYHAVEYKGGAFKGPFELPNILKAKIFKVAPEQEPEPEPAEEIILPTFTVTGTVWGTDNPAAIIDAEIYGVGDKVRVKVGEEVKEAEILLIDKQGVLLLYRGKTIRVKVPGFFQGSGE